ncbi:MAG: DNA cytosine methyltransferase [Candidatus Fonsibacter sp.]
MQRLPRVVIIENVRGLILKRNAVLLAQVKDIVRGLHYSIHIRILCTSQPAVPQSRGRCYMVGIRGPKGGLKWPKVLIVVGLQHLLDRKISQ